MYEDDREEEISQSDAEPVKKVTINDASTLQSVDDDTDQRGLQKRSPWCP